LKICMLDFETTGLNCQTCEVTEVAAITFDTNGWKFHDMFTTLVNCKLPLPDKITELTGIRDEDITNYGMDVAEVFHQLARRAISADYLMAHNADFDKGFFVKGIKNLFGLQRVSKGEIEAAISKPWIDTLIDVPWGDLNASRSLPLLLKRYGSPKIISAHRAMGDCLAVIDLIKRNFNFGDILTRSAEPIIYFTPFYPGPSNDELKASGFFWNNFFNTWTKKARLSDIERVQDFKFGVQALNENKEVVVGKARVNG